MYVWLPCGPHKYPRGPHYAAQGRSLSTPVVLLFSQRTIAFHQQEQFVLFRK